MTLTATVCSSNNASKKFYVGNELGKTQIQITLVGDQVAMLVLPIHSTIAKKNIVPLGNSAEIFPQKRVNSSGYKKGKICKFSPANAIEFYLYWNWIAA